MADRPNTPPKGLPLPVRRMIACLAILAFLVVYVWGVMALGEFIKGNKALSLIFYSLAGLLWGLPVLPVISWSEAYRRKR